MAADTAAKRYSAMDIGRPWRGLNVVPDVTIPQGERQAVMFMYSGISAGPPTPPSSGGDNANKIRVGIVAGGRISDGNPSIGGMF